MFNVTRFHDELRSVLQREAKDGSSDELDMLDRLVRAFILLGLSSDLAQLDEATLRRVAEEAEVTLQDVSNFLDSYNTLAAVFNQISQTNDML